jgi:hypothetical protein
VEVEERGGGGGAGSNVSTSHVEVQRQKDPDNGSGGGEGRGQHTLRSDSSFGPLARFTEPRTRQLMTGFFALQNEASRLNKYTTAATGAMAILRGTINTYCT